MKSIKHWWNVKRLRKAERKVLNAFGNVTFSKEKK